MCEGDTATEHLDVESVKRCLSSPSLAVPHVTRKVPPAPIPRRKSAAEECQRANNIKNCARSTATTTAPGVSRTLELGAGVKAQSCHDIKSLCMTADCCGHENNDLRASELASSVTDGSFSTNSTHTLDITVSADRTVKRPAIPPRFKRRLRKDDGNSGTDKISSACKKISVSRMESVSDSESEAVKQSRKLFPQPKPRMSLLLNTALPADENDQEQSKILHNASNELAVDGDSESVCLDAERDRNSETTGEGLQLHTHTDNNYSSVEPEQCELEAKNGVSAVSLKSEVLVPTRAAPPPPLPKPKILLHASGSFEIIQRCGDCDGPVHTTLSDRDITADSVNSTSVSENDDKTMNESSLQQPVEDSEACLFSSLSPTSPESCVSDVFYQNGAGNATPPSVVLSSATPVALSSTAKSEQSNGDGGCEITFPKPAVRRKKGKSELLCGISSSADFERHLENVNVPSRAGATRSWSEDIVHGDNSSDLHLTPADVEKSSLKRSQAQYVPSRPFSLSEPGRHHAASDLRRNSSSDSSCVTETSCLSPVVTPTNSPQSRINHELFAADTPPITPSAFRFDAHDEEARMVC